MFPKQIKAAVTRTKNVGRQKFVASSKGWPNICC